MTVVPFIENGSGTISPYANTPSLGTPVTERKDSALSTVSTLESAPPSPTPFLPTLPSHRMLHMRETFVLEDGSHYTGQVKVDIEQRASRAEGWGTLTYPPGHIRSDYEGEFEGGQPNGSGKVRFRAGGSYTGQMQAGEITGIGTITYASNHRVNRFNYKGAFVNGWPQGEGIMRYRDGSTYKGAFQNGVWEGKGKYWKPNSYFIEGTFKNGRIWDGRDGMAPKIEHTYKDGKRQLAQECCCVIL